MNLIIDWQFYVVAVPAVLLLGVSKSGFGAGFGSLAVPLMALSVTVPQAAAILMPVLLVMDLLGIAAFRKDVDRALLKFMLPWGLLGIVIGTLSFKLLQARWVAGIVGVFTLLSLLVGMWAASRVMSPVTELARRLQTLATRFDPDWSLPFTRVFGDIVGVQVANAVRAGLQQARIAAGSLAGSAAEYATEESRDVVGREELNAFHDDVDAIRDDVERLAVRIGRLAARMEHRA